MDPSPPLVNGDTTTTAPPPENASNLLSHRLNAEDPQEQMIGSLRSQINDLFQQVTQLNNKLVQSYDRVSDLEDNLHVTSSNLRGQTLKISQLELERSQHLSALDTGLLVEKDHVTAELSRLMERVSEEAVQRGQAENAKHEIEKELDDLSANLFQQANTMVAEARWSKALSERKVVDTENALKGAEEAISSMQTQMQTLTSEREQADTEVARFQEMMGKGKWIERQHHGTTIAQVRLSNASMPYQEYLAFITHLRSLRPTAPQPPAVSSLLPLPFLARLLAEDSDTALRLDLAPSLNWLTRRSVQSAIHGGQLVIEPVPSSHLLLDLSHSLVSTPASHQELSCSMCGKLVFGGNSSAANNDTPASSPTSQLPTWASAKFLKSQISGAITNAAPPSRPTTPPAIPANSHVFVFRLYLPPPQKPTTTYPLCQHGWCLTRLRATCELWQFIRKNLIEQVWAEVLPTLPTKPKGIEAAAAPVPKPPLPPRRRVSEQVGKFWGMGLGALGMDKMGTSGAMSRYPSEPKPSPPIPEVKQDSFLPAPPLPSRSPSRGPSRETSPLPPPPQPLAEVNKEQPAVPTTNEATPPPSMPTVGAEEPTPSSAEPQSTVTFADGEDIPAHDHTESHELFNADTMSNFSTPIHTAPSSPIRPNRRPISAALAAGFPLPDSPSNSRPTSPMKPTNPLTGTAAPPVPRRAPGRGLRPIPPPPPIAISESAEVAVAVVAKLAAVEADPAKIPEETEAAPIAAAPPLDHEAKDEASLPPPPQYPTIAPTPATEPVDEPKPTVTVESTPTLPASPPPLPPRSHPVEEPTIPEKEKEIAPQVEDPTIVTNKTWEERAWKELIRLREDLFWARVGGVR